MRAFLMFTLFMMLIVYSTQSFNLTKIIKQKLNEIKEDFTYKIDDKKKEIKDFGSNMAIEFNERLAKTYNDAMKSDK